MTASEVERFLDRLEGVRRNGVGWMARCPAHEDRSPSLHVKPGEDQPVVFTCYAGCDPDAILAALGIGWADVSTPKTERDRRIVATYPYVDETNTLLFEVVRYEPKDFKQRRPDGRGGWAWKLGDTRRVLYHLPEVLTAVEAQKTVFVVEGEKDADRLTREGVTATTCPGGAGKWRTSYGDALHGADVVVVADRDDAGRRHARHVAAALRAVAGWVVVVEPAAGKDVSDHLAAGLTVDDLIPVGDAAGGDQADAAGGDQADAAGGDQADAAGGDQLPIVSASEIQPVRPEWVWQSRLPVGGVALIAGREGQGKTALVLDVAARVTRGTLPGDWHGRPGTVLYIGAEDDAASVLVPRLIAARADLDRVKLVARPAGVTLAEDHARLAATLARLDDLALIVVDPLDSHLGARLDSHRKSEVQAAIGLLAEVAQDHRCAAVGVAHLNKGDARDLLTRVMGSAGFTTSTRIVLGIGEHPEEQADRLAVMAKSNFEDRYQVPAVRFRVEGCEVETAQGDVIPTGRVVWLGEETGHNADALLDVPSVEERTERDAAAEWLHEILVDGPVPSAEVKRLAREAGHTERTLHRARKPAGVKIERDDQAQGRPSSWSFSGTCHLVSCPAHTPGGGT